MVEVDIIALVLRYVHIASGIAWIGAIMYSVGVLRFTFPRADPPAVRGVLRHMLPVVRRYVPVAAILTIGFGALLYVYMGVFNPAILLNSRWGQLLLIALGLTVGVFVYGLIWGLGTAGRLLPHLEEEKEEHMEEVMALTRRFNRVQVVILLVGLLIIGLMVYVTGTL